MRTGRSRPTLWFALLGLAVSGLPFSSVSLPDAGSAPPPLEASAYGNLPVVFEPNQGQTDPAVRFLTRGTDHAVYLTATGSLLSLAGPDGSGPTRVSMDLVGSNPDPMVEGTDRLKGRINYLVGDDPAAWRAGIPTFAKVAYRQVYPGIDLVWYGRDGVLEYDFVVAPGADPTRIALEVSGAESLAIDPDGALVMGVPGGEVRQGAPVVFQEVDEARVPVEGRFVLTGTGRVSFEVPDYDRAWPLVIDPTLVYSTYFGGNGNPDKGKAIAVDRKGHVYVAGHTMSTGFPATSSGSGVEAEAFVVKLDRDGNEIEYLTVFGGSGDDTAEAIAVADGIAYVGGSTTSTNFPVEDPSQPGPGGDRDAFAVQLDEDGGGFEYSTYLGGSARDYALDIATDGDENAFLVGTTESDDFPVEEETQPLAGGKDVFVTMLDPDAALVYSTYLGGSDDEEGLGIAVDGDGDAYVAGRTASTNFPVVLPAYQQGNEGGTDAFVAKFDDDGQSLEYSTYLGGPGDDEARGVAVDSDDQVYLTGFASDGFPTEFALQPAGAGMRDTFVAAFDEDGRELVYSTFLGGSDEDQGHDIAVDKRGNAYVVGETLSTDFFVLSPTIQAAIGHASAQDAFVAKINTGGDQLEYSTYLGGAGSDIGWAVAVDGKGNAYITGETESANFPTNNPLQDSSMSHIDDAFIAKIDG